MKTKEPYSTAKFGFVQINLDFKPGVAFIVSLASNK